jgi:hypothetical protein
MNSGLKQLLKLLISLLSELRHPNCDSGARRPFHSLRSLKQTNLQEKSETALKRTNFWVLAVRFS